VGVSVSCDVKSVAEQFDIPGTPLTAEPWGRGHIHDTYLVTCSRESGPVRYICQRVNQNVFTDPVGLTENLCRVTDHIRNKLRATDTADIERRTLTVVPAKDGRPYLRESDGGFWRMFLFVENTHTLDGVNRPEQAYQVARAFGEFQQIMQDLPGPRLNETIPDFHNTPKRFETFHEARAVDVCGRTKDVQPEIEFAMDREPISTVLVDLQRNGDIPERVTHNDTKFSNVLIDDSTGQGICVIDLDTVMPGLALYDFGDMVRTATSPAYEGGPDLDGVHMHMSMFEALVRGYLSCAAPFLNETERRYLAFSGKLITLEIGLRFLTDYLQGDTYFNVHRENQNLHRCRAQFKLVESIERQESEMNRFVEEFYGGGAE